MDNQNTNTNTLFNNILQPLPVAPPPMPQPSNPVSRILNWFKSHKKLSIVVAAVFIGLLVYWVIGLLGYLKISNQIPTPFNNTPEVNLPSSMQIKTSKTTYTLNEKIQVSAIASSNNEAVVGFDTAIEYDPEALTLSKKEPPSITDFEYFSSNGNGIFRASAVLKPGSISPKAFDNTTLFDIEFTPKKPGKTALKIIYMPNSTNDSNLLNGDSKDILGNARGVEVTIE